jgi:adenylosuccinate synthase
MPRTPSGAFGREAARKSGAKKHHFHIVPVGVMYPDCMNLLGNGVVVHLPTLLQELRTLDENGLSARKRLLISNRAHLVMECHKNLDGIYEDMRDLKLGTTNRGIGPCYCTKTIRNGVRVGDLLHFQDFSEKVRHLAKYFDGLHKAHTGKSSLEELEKELKQYEGYAKEIAGMVTDTSLLLRKALQEEKRVVVEGANSTLSDLDFGTYPFVTSSPTTVGGVCTGLGLAPSAVSTVVGVCKAYATRAQRWFPTEITLDDAVATHLRERGREYGTTTNKARRVGWLDVPVVRYSAALNGFDSLVLTKLGVLSGLPKLRLGVLYERLDGSPYPSGWFPPSLEEYANVRVQYEELPGWTEDLSKYTAYSALPAAARKYVERVAALAGSPITWVQVGDGSDSFLRVE